MRIFAPIVATLCIACGMASAAEHDGAKTVVFVCEHGNVKSLMAASYFNQLAAQRGLPFHALARGVAPNSTTVPQPIASGLRADGVDVSEFQPSKVATADVVGAARIVAIGTELPTGLHAEQQRTERWTDVPAASTDYDAARDSLKAHVADLLNRLDAAAPK